MAYLSSHVVSDVKCQAAGRVPQSGGNVACVRGFHSLRGMLYHRSERTPVYRRVTAASLSQSWALPEQVDDSTKGAGLVPMQCTTGRSRGRERLISNI